MSRKPKGSAASGLRPAERATLLLTGLVLALSVGWRLGTRRQAPTVTLSQTSLVRSAEEPTRSVEAEEKLDLNRATAEELRQLTGVGEVLAERIVAYREEHGPFRRVEDITLVRGIGSAIYEANRDRLCVEEERP